MVKSNLKKFPKFKSLWEKKVFPLNKKEGFFLLEFGGFNPKPNPKTFLGKRKGIIFLGVPQG